MPQPSSDPQLLSKVLRTKLGLGWDPRWDQPLPIPEQHTLDQPAAMPLGGLPMPPMPQVNESAMLRARMQAPDMDRRLPLMAGPTM